MMKFENPNKPYFWGIFIFCQNKEKSNSITFIIQKNSKGLWIIVASIWNMIPNKESYDLDLIGFG